MSGRAAARIRVDEAHAAEPAAAPPPRAERMPQPAGRSPLDLQREVAEAIASGAFDPRAGEGPPDRWSGRQTLGFIFVTCSAFWICVGFLLTELKH